MLISPRLAVLSTLLMTETPIASAKTIQLEAPNNAAIREKIMRKAIYVPPSATDRKLSDSSSYTDDSSSYTDYYASSGHFYNAFGFNPTAFSLSYSRCAQVRQFDDQMAAREDTPSVFTTKHFAIFRFCPSKSCDPYAIKPVESDEDDQQQNENQQQEQRYMGMSFATYQAYRQDKYTQYQYTSQQAKEAAAASFKEIQDQFTVGGAAGSGCSTNYGEYMIELEDYLEIMTEHMNDRFGEYCSSCEKCMYSEYKNWAQKQGGRARDLFEQSDEGWRHLEFERQLGGCDQYNECKSYYNACKNGLEDDITGYFTCTQSGNVYVGPHCAEDGVSITLGAYADEDCNEYAGDVYSLAGETVDQEALDIWSTGNLNALMPESYQENMFELYGGWESMCIPCSEADASRYNGVDDATVVNGLCLTLYETSARCDHHFNNYQSKSKSIGLYDKERMQLSCDYIDKAKMGNYDESGLPSLSESPLIKAGFLKDTQYYDAAYPYMSKVSGWQIFGLVASLLACIALGAWSIRLHRSLTAKGQWRPTRRNRNAALAHPVGMARPDSGIGMARQQSGPSYYMS